MKGGLSHIVAGRSAQLAVLRFRTKNPLEPFDFRFREFNATAMNIEPLENRIAPATTGVKFHLIFQTIPTGSTQDNR